MLSIETKSAPNPSYLTNRKQYVNSLTDRLNLLKITAVATLAISFLVGALALAYQLPLITLASAFIGLGAAVLFRDARHISSEIPKIISDFIDKNPQQYRTWIVESLSIDPTKDQQELKSLKSLQERYSQLLDDNEHMNYEKELHHFLYKKFKAHYSADLQKNYSADLGPQPDGPAMYLWYGLKRETSALFTFGYQMEKYPDGTQEQVKKAIYQAATAYTLQHCFLNKPNHPTVKNIKNVVLKYMTTRTFKEAILRNTFTIFSWMLP